jgi:hypothetical protein
MTFALKYRDRRHGPDGVTIFFVNADKLTKACQLVEEEHIEFMDSETYPLLEYDEYPNNCVVGQVQLNSDVD